MPEPTVFNGRYELHRRLGRGGMAEVFLARDLQLDRPVAVKVLFTEYANDPAFVARFRREAQAAANLNHPNIVSVYDWGQEHGTYYIVMEYVDGPTLAELIRRDGAVDPERAIDIADDVASALGHAHARGVLHRDIKPGNILISSTGRTKVADWGIGRAMDAAADENLTQTGAVMGTATYFSPEQAQGLPLDPRSDLYSLGVVLYEALTGAPPFQGDSPVAIAYKHVHEQPRPVRVANSAVPAGLEAIIDQLLAKDPAARYASADSLRADLRRFREGAPLEAATRAVPRVGAAAATGDIGATQAIPAAQATRAAAAYRDHTRALAAEQAAFEEPPEKRSSPAFLVALVLLLLVLAGLLYLLARQVGVFDDGGSEVAQVEVPTVVGQHVDIARQTLEDLGFEVEVEPMEVTDPAQVDIVQEQEPAGGILAEEGSVVTLRVGAQELIQVPDLSGSTPDAAEATLRAAGFTGSLVPVEEPSEDVEAGLIIRTEPPAGSEVAVNGEIRLIVSSGPPPVAVPAVSPGDCDVDAYRNLLADNDLRFTTAQEPSDAVEEGCIIRTDPPAGTEVEPGTRVTIVVSSGPAPVEVPDVMGLGRQAAVDRLAQAGLQASVTTRPARNGEPAGVVVDQNPRPGAERERGDTVTIIVTEPSGETSTTDVGD